MLYSTLFWVLFIHLGTSLVVNAGISHISDKSFQQITDSTGLKVIYNEKDLRTRHRYTINIYINRALYESDAYPEHNYIYIPDTLKQHDKIKITVKPSGSGQRWTNQIVKRKSYTFDYLEFDKVFIKIKYKKGLNALFRQNPKRRPPDFW